MKEKPIKYLLFYKGQVPFNANICYRLSFCYVLKQKLNAAREKIEEKMSALAETRPYVARLRCCWCRNAHFTNERARKHSRTGANDDVDTVCRLPTLYICRN